MTTQHTPNISISQNDTIFPQKWQKRAPDSFTSQTIRSLDEFKALFKNGSFRPAVLTNEGLLVNTTKIHKMDSFFQQ